MRRGYRCAFFLAVLSACITLSGCKSGGTTILADATTSFPNAVIGTPYAATLTATGGTPGYTWSQISGGAMPAGISLASTGAFNGAPTAPGTFGPYVFQVTDSTGAVATSGGLSITTTNGGLGRIIVWDRARTGIRHRESSASGPACRVPAQCTSAGAQ